MPFSNNDETVLEFALHQWAENTDGMLQFLEEEKRNQGIWIKVAMDYYHRNDMEGFLLILERSIEAASAQADNILRVYDLLAAGYIEMAYREVYGETKKKYLLKAKEFLTLGDNVLMYDGYHMAVRAFFFLFVNDPHNLAILRQAEEQFNFTSLQKPRISVAEVGNAFVCYFKRDYREAMTMFRRILQANPHCPAAFRVAIGYSALKLGNCDLAKVAFERALDLKPDCCNALVGLSIMYINCTSANATKLAVQMLARVYNLNSKNPMVLSHLSNHFFFKKDYGKALQLALHAHNYAESDAMRAEILYNIGRCYHVQNNSHEAFQYYFQSAQIAPKNFALPYYRLGQLHMDRCDFKKAIVCFEKLHDAMPEDLDTLECLGILYAKFSGDPKKLDKAKLYLETITQKRPNDIEAWIELASVLEKDNFQQSLRAYQSLCKVHMQHFKTEVPIEYLNNMAALYYRMGEYQRSVTLLLKSLRLLETRLLTTSPKKYTALKVMMTYNLARAYECLRNDATAEALYKEILLNHPVYVDCHLRLGCMERNRGQIFDASGYFNEALVINSENIDTLILLGNLYSSKMQFEEASHQFEKIIGKRSSQLESYALIALGNMHLATLHRPNRKASSNKLVGHIALDYYNKVLRCEDKNVYAANGVGTILAHLGHFNEARDIFSQVRESTADFSDVWVNIAHIYVENCQYGNAIQMYLNCIKRFRKHGDVKLMRYLARAYFRAGRLEDAKLTVLRAMHVAPDNLNLIYSLGVILQRISLNVLQNERASLVEVVEAVNDITRAKSYFELLIKNADGSDVKLETLQNDLQFCEDIKQQSQFTVQRAEVLDAELRASRRNHEADRLAFLKHQAEKRKEREEEERQKAAYKLKIHQACAEKVKSLRQAMDPLPDDKGQKKRHRIAKAQAVAVEAGETQNRLEDICSEGSSSGGAEQRAKNRTKKGKTKMTSARKTKRQLVKRTPKANELVEGDLKLSTSDEDTLPRKRNRGSGKSAPSKKSSEGLRIVSKEFISTTESEDSDTERKIEKKTVDNQVEF